MKSLTTLLLFCSLATAAPVGSALAGDWLPGFLKERQCQDCGATTRGFDTCAACLARKAAKAAADGAKAAADGARDAAGSAKEKWRQAEHPCCLCGKTIHVGKACASCIFVAGRRAAGQGWGEAQEKAGEVCKVLEARMREIRRQWDLSGGKCALCGGGTHLQGVCAACGAKEAAGIVTAVAESNEALDGRSVLLCIVAQTNLVRYGHWYGPDWSGGQQPSQNDGKMGSLEPVDSLDEAARDHDLAYYLAGQAAASQERLRLIREADIEFANVLHSLKSIGCANWRKPPQDPVKAQDALEAALVVFDAKIELLD